MEKNSTIIQVNSISKSYGKHRAVNDVSFNLNKGEIFGLLGPNGAGKTTTLECIEGIRQPDSGTISVAGFSPSKGGAKFRKALGVQLQTSALPNLIRIDEAMSLVCGYQHRAYRKDLLKKFDLEGLAKRKYYSLSTGQKRRLNLALALVSDPQVVILDEPTAGLDVEARINLHSIIRELKSNGITILLATHDMAEAEELCDKITILINGKSAVTGTPSEITSASCTKSKVKIRTRDGSLLNDNNCVQGYAEFLTDDAANLVIQLLTKVTVCNDTVEDLRIERPSLEERFIEIIKGGKTA